MIPSTHKPLASLRALYRELIQESAKSVSLPHYLPKNVIKDAFKNPSSNPALGLAALAELQFRNTIYKGTDTEPPLSPKSKEIKFSIGDVLIHSTTNENLIVVAYDSECRASKNWQLSRGVSDPSQPFYTCLVDVRDCKQATIVYIAQDHLIRASDVQKTSKTKTMKTISGSSSRSVVVSSGPSAGVSSIGVLQPLVLHPSLPKYFSLFSPPGQYVMTSALMNLYPHDAMKVPLLTSIEARAKEIFDSIKASHPPVKVQNDDDDDDDGEGDNNETKRLI